MRAATKPRKPRHCRPTWAVVATLPNDPDWWGLLLCERCRRPHRWLAEPPQMLVEVPGPPPEPPAWLVALSERHQGPPAALDGTEKQRRWAESLRIEMKVKYQGDPTALGILDVVTHSKWFITTNRDDGNILHRSTRDEVVASTDQAARPGDG